MTIIVDIDLETGDLTEFDATVTDGGDLSAAAGAALAATTNGLSCVIDDTTAIYGRAVISAPASNTLRGRVYIDPNTLTMADGNTFRFLRCLELSTGYRVLSLELLYTSADGYQLVYSAVNDAGDGNTVCTTVITDAPHYIEFLYQRAAGASTNDGVATAWIDGVQAGTLTNLDNYTRFSIMDRLDLGAPFGLDAGTSGTFYLDQLVVNDTGSEIGAYSPPAAGTLPPLAMHHYRLRRAA